MRADSQKRNRAGGSRTTPADPPDFEGLVCEISQHFCYSLYDNVLSQSTTSPKKARAGAPLGKWTPARCRPGFWGWASSQPFVSATKAVWMRLSTERWMPWLILKQTQFRTCALPFRITLAALIEPSKSSPSLPQTVDSVRGFRTPRIWNPLRRLWKAEGTSFAAFASRAES